MTEFPSTLRPARTATTRSGEARTASPARRAAATPFQLTHVRWWLAAVLTVMAVGTAGFVAIERWTAWDAFYMTVITMTTVGFHEIYPLGTAGQAWAMLVALSGVGLIFALAGVVAETMVIEVTSGKREARRMTRQIDALRDHYVLCGFGRVGSTVARANQAGAEDRLIRAGANRVVSPYAMAGHRLAGLALRPRVVDFVDAALSHGDLAFALEEVTATPGGSIVGSTVGNLRDQGIYTLAVVTESGEYEANPGPDRSLAAGESLIVSGSAATLAWLHEHA